MRKVFVKSDFDWNNFFLKIIEKYHTNLNNFSSDTFVNNLKKINFKYFKKK